MNSGNSREDGTTCGFGGCYYNRPDDRSDTYNELSTRAGIATNYDVVNYFFQTSLGFRPPQINEAYRLQKKQNVIDLDSEKLTMIEIGTTFNLENLNGSLSVYKSKKRNSIFRDSENFIIDNGKTNHKGVELTLNINISERSNLISNFTYGDHKYDFNSDTSMQEKIRIGNEIDTSPKLMANLILNASVTDNLSFAFELERMDSYFTDAANLHEYEGHTLLHFRSDLSYSEKLTLYLRADNLSDKDYAERADFNAYGGDRYFPGLPRETYVGFEYSL
jgi:outer membrane receptor protein involved in Fe transport